MPAAQAPDIFDQVSAAPPSGDIFDQVSGEAPKSPEELKFENDVQSKAIASIPKPAFLSGQPRPVDVLPGPFGFENQGGIAPVGPTHAVPQPSTLDYVKAALSFTPPQSETETVPGAATEISAAQHLATPGQRWQGAKEAVQGVGEVAAPLMGPAATEMAAAPELVPALKFGAGLATGVGGQPLAEKFAEKAGAGPEQQKFWGELAFWAPQIAGLVASQAGVKGGIESTDEGTRAAVTGFGGKAGAGVAVTPEGVTVRGKVGPFEASKTFSRGGQPAAPGIEPPTIEANAPPPPSDDLAITSMANSKQAEVESAKRAAGIPPPPPPVPPRVVDEPNAPPELKQGHISQRLVDSFARVVSQLPETQRAQAIQEAHGTLTKVLLEGSQKGPMVGPDWKLFQVEDAADASKQAMALIHSAVARYEKSLAEVQPPSTLAASPSPSNIHSGQSAGLLQAEKAKGDIFDQLTGFGEAPDRATAGASPETSQGPVSNESPLKKGDRAVLMKATEVGGTTVPAGTAVTIRYVHPRGSLVRAIADDGTTISRGYGAFQRSRVEPKSQETAIHLTQSESAEKKTIAVEPKVIDTIAPGKVGEVKTSDLKVAPNRFQYKLGTDAAGTSTLLKEAKIFNPDLAGTISVWKDPADGKTYVVNGHHRYELAKRLGQKEIAVRHIVAKGAVEARAIGAQQNIAEGRGTPVDAAKFFRDSGVTPADLERHGISLGEATAAKGLALSSLDDTLFRKVVEGELREGRAVAIGEATRDPAEQKAILSLVERKERSGSKVSDDTLSELIRLVKGSEQKTETTADLFGTQEISRSLALEKAEISAHIKQQLAKDKKLFGFVAKEGRADELARAGNKIDVERSKEISTGAAQAEEVYNKLSERGGPIATILDEAARKLAAGESLATVKSDAYTRVRAEVSKTLGGSEGASAGGSEAAPETPAPVRQESPVEPTLPGMEHVPAERAEANAEQQGKDLSAKLTEPPKSIESKAGEIEQKSPLFKDTEANPQAALFGNQSPLAEESHLPVAQRLITGTAGEEDVLGPLHAAANLSGVVGDYVRSEAHLNKIARELHSGIYDLEAAHSAQVLRAVQVMEKAKDEYGASLLQDAEAVYHHLENPEESLNPEQNKLLDEDVIPIMEATDENFVKLKELLGQDADLIENYVHRVVKDKGGWFDRIASGSTKGGTGRGNLLSKSAPQAKGRTMMALEADNVGGRRVTVAIKGNQVTAFKDGKTEDLGSLSSGLTTKLDLLSQRLDPLVKRIGELREQIARTPEEDKAKRIASVDEKISQLRKERDTLSEVKGRKLGENAVYGTEVTFGKRKAITEKIDALEQERARIQESGHMSNAGEERARRLKESMRVVESERNRILETVPTDQLQDSVWIDKNGKRWKITQATTKEIESDTDLKYFHNALASALVSNLQITKALRGAEFIEAFKSSPEFQEIAHRQGEGNPPAGWKTTQLPQLRDYSFEPHVAEVLDWYADRIRGKDPGIMDKIGQFLRTSIFFNPLIHTPNIAVHWGVERGLTGYNPLRAPQAVRAGLKAINAVIHQNEDFLAALDVGAPLQSHREDTSKVTQLFFEQLTDGLEKKEDWALDLAKRIGMSPVDLVKGIYRFSGKATWVTNDIALLQSAYEKQARTPGMSLKEALKETSKHIPDYRLPTRMLNSRALAKVLSNPNITMFMAYHYGAAKSYGEAAKSSLGISEPATGRTKAGEVAHGWELLATIGLVTFVLYPLLDKLVQALSGDKNAKIRRAGAATLPYNIYQAATKQKSVGDVVQSVATPAVQTKSAAELIANRDFFTGRNIYDSAADWETQGKQVFRFLMQAVSPVGQASRAIEGGEQGRKRFAWGLVGVSFPKTRAERLAQEIEMQKVGTKAQTPQSREDYVERRDILDELRKGNHHPLELAKSKHEITSKQAHIIERRAKMTPLQDTVHGFSYSEIMRVMKEANPEEKKELERTLREKRMRMMEAHRAREVEAVEAQ
jgi:hypothetical protein